MRPRLEPDQARESAPPPGSRHAESCRLDYRIDGAEELALNHPYRLMRWPRDQTDAIEEAPFARASDLLTDTSLSFF